MGLQGRKNFMMEWSASQIDEVNNDIEETSSFMVRS